ncbi:MAG: hypothetical protein CV087_10670, partial [Candidatus Brocadia sp. WS118]
MHRLQNYKNTVDLNLRKALKNKPILHLDRVEQKLYATTGTDYIYSTQPKNNLNLPPNLYKNK